MKRFILCSLSATMTLAAGSAVHAQTTDNTIAQLDSDSYQCIEEDRRAGENRFEYRSQSLVGGILSPDDSGPNNRAMPTTGLGNYYEERFLGDSNVDCYAPGRFDADRYDPSSNNRRMPMDNQRMPMDNQMDERDYPTEGTILSPDDSGPNNRAVPGSGPGQVNQDQRMQMNNQMDERDYPTEGTILSPDDSGPSNRAVPGRRPGQGNE